MEKVFSNFRINKNIDRTGVNLLLKNIRKKTPIVSDIVFTAISSDNKRIEENWIIQKSEQGKYKYICLDRYGTMFKTTVLNSLVLMDIVIVILICDLNQKLKDGTYIKEMWGFKVYKNKNKTVFENITSEEIYKHSTTNVDGKKIPQQKEMVYCGPDGKICGWDRD